MDGPQDPARKKRVGWLCSYVPEELILAAGMEPVRLCGQAESGKEAEAYICQNLCPYVKSVLDSGLAGNLKGVEGAIFTNSCDGMRRLYDVWTRYVSTPFIHMLELPKNRDEDAIRYFADQLLELKNRLEKFSEAPISQERVREAISFMNHRRATMVRILENQKTPVPPWKGSELLGLCLEEMTSPKEAMKEKLDRFSGNGGSRDSAGRRIPRVLIMGNVIDKANLFIMVEDSGAAVVAFDTCCGLRHYSLPAQGGPDPMVSLAQSYLLRPQCPRMPGFQGRLDRLDELVQAYSADGIIYSTVKFCDYGLLEAPLMERHLRKNRIPFLFLENDYLWGDEGRLRTRVEAFVEIIQGEVG